ncbi:Helicase-like protein [Variovorax sp. WDL1]|nr:Helicase-like protein [Variovorax sp. WDL1]
MAFDGCKEMAELASATCGQEVLHLRFDEVVWQGAFDGVWASGSLLHLDDSAQVDALQRLARSLRPGGVLCAVMERGEGTSVASDGRFFNYTTTEKFARVVARAGLGQFESFAADSYLAADGTVWLTMCARKPYL